MSEKIENSFDRYENEDCNGHDYHEVLNRRHMDAMGNAERLVNGNMKSWLIMDNAYDNVDIEMKRLSMISKDLDMIDTTSNMDMITKLFDDIVLIGPNCLPLPPYQTI